MRLSHAALFLLAAPLAAQEPRKLTADDYAKAEKYLGATTAGLVSGLVGRPTFLDDGRFWYRATIANGGSFFIVDPAKRSREAFFDHTRLAAALASASGGRVEGNRLPAFGIELSKDSRSITLPLQNKRWKCDLQQYTCAAADSAPANARAPQNSSVSPDGKTAVFIK